MFWRILVGSIVCIFVVVQVVGLVKDLRSRKNKSVINKDNLKGDNTNK